MNHKSFFKQIFLFAVVVLFYSCDKDYNVLGSDVIGDNHFMFKDTTFSVVARNQKIGPIQSNNLPVNALGIYDNPVFGTTAANYATQVVLEKTAPVILADNNPVVESVVLTVPYFSKLKSTDTDGNNTYTLDSIYGPASAKIKLSVYESGLRMDNVAPIEGVPGLPVQNFFTNQNVDFDSKKVGERLNDTLNDVAQNDAFFFDAKEHVEKTKDSNDKEVITRTKPGMRLKLNKKVFEDKIIKAVPSKLATNEAFKDHFRGLYFKVEKSSSAGNMAMLDFSAGKITIKYKENETVIIDGLPTKKRVLRTLVLKLAGGLGDAKTGNTVGLLEQSNETPSYADAITAPNINTGDRKLYLKGGEGALTIIDLFKTPGELEKLQKEKWLINEANLVFHIDRDEMKKEGVVEPNRIYLYDLTNNRPLVDYGDASEGTNPKNGKVIFDGNLKKEAGLNGRGLTYKIRITNQIRNLIRNADSTNVRLGLVVTENINDPVSYKLRIKNTSISQAPRASVMSPLGTVLFGNNIPLGDKDYDKRLKLEIFYTKPN